VTLPTTTAEELRFADWLTARLGVVPGLEEALSGRGLEYIHAFLCHEDGEGTPLAAAAIMAAFLAGDARAVQAARIFVRYLARYAGDLALINLPFGGIYLVGGVAKHLGPHLLDLGLAEGFAAKGRFSDFMAQFPMYLVTDDYVALRGCAGHLAELEALG
jgi:glucokinase